MRCSMTWVTVSSSVRAEAPGKIAVTVIAGGAMAGYCDTGSFRIERTPAIMMMIASTHAKIGRSMKNLAMAWSSPAQGAFGLAAAGADAAGAGAAGAGAAGAGGFSAAF